MYAIAPLGSTLGELGYGGPGYYQNLTEYSYASDLLGALPLSDVKVVNSVLGTNPVGVYLLVSRPEIAYGVINDGLPPSFGTDLTTMLIASKQYKVVYQNQSGVILQRVMTPPPAGA